LKKSIKNEKIPSNWKTDKDNLENRKEIIKSRKKYSTQECPESFNFMQMSHNIHKKKFNLQYYQVRMLHNIKKYQEKIAFYREQSKW
jgi:hypothetical protein